MINLFCVQRNLKLLFENLATFIAKYPKWVILISILSSVLIGLGGLRFKFESDFDYLFSPYNCRAYQEKETLNKLFPMNRSLNFDFFRLTERGRFGSIIVTSKDGGNVLREEKFSEIIKLDNIIKSIGIKWEDNVYNFSSICAKSNGNCQDNNLILFGSYIRNTEGLKYPATVDLEALTYSITAINLGGVTVDNNDNILEAKAFRLFYFLDDSDEQKDNLAVLWEKEFLNRISCENSEHLVITWFSSYSFNYEIWTFAIDAVKLFWIVCIIIAAFTILSSMTFDWARSKPLLGFAGCVSVVLSVVSSFGFVILCGLSFTAVNIAIPFLILGIGLDDMFILIAAWRRTDPRDKVNKRMSESYSEAAMSVTITSLTNFLSFCVGMMAPFPAVRIFCVYATAAIFFTYIYQLTFFGGCMALDGYREQNNLHPLTFRPLVSSENAVNRGRLYRLLFVQSVNDNEAPKAMIWCREVLGAWISKKWSRICIMFLFIVYLSGAVYGITTLQEGIEHKDVYPKSSYAFSYATDFNRYFTQYPYPIQVVINRTMDFSDSKVQNQVLNILDQFEQSPYIEDSKPKIFWLPYYLYFINEPRFWLYHGRYNFSNPQDFINCLKNVFLRYPLAQMFQNDIKFSKNGNEIIATRFVIVSKNITKLMTEKAMLINVRAIADASQIPVTVQSLLWVNYEQFLILEKLTIQMVTITAIVIVFVFLIFIPHIPNVICITFSIVSIELGVIGYMALWGVTLNTISAIVLTICIGFSIDYAAHASYAYLSLRDSSSEERTKHVLYSVGVPILQGSLSTILCILIFFFVDSYIFVNFFKIVFLVIVFAVFHGLLILPVLLSTWDITYNAMCTRKNKLQTDKYFEKSESIPMTMKNNEVLS